jgi:hypothetical protein
MGMANMENAYSKRDIKNVIQLGLEEYNQERIEQYYEYEDYEKERDLYIQFLEERLEEEHPDDLFIDMIDYESMPMTEQVVQGLSFDPFYLN